jgi:putative phosphoribosyl transferase
MHFKDRGEAADKLGMALAKYRGTKPIVYAIPRGSIYMAERIAKELDGELDVVLVRKLGSPLNKEVAIGAVAESGWFFLHAYAPSHASFRQINAIKTAQLDKIRKRRAAYGTPARSCQGRVAIVVDGTCLRSLAPRRRDLRARAFADGLATGATMIAALHALRKQNPSCLVMAVPVAATDSLLTASKSADATVCLSDTYDFATVGQFYTAFDEVEDEEVVQVLQRNQ